MFKSRKFSIAVLLVLVATALLALSLISQATWLDVMRLVGGGYFAANVGQKAIEQAGAALQAKLAGPKA